MIDTAALPSPTAPPEHHADFLELTAFKSRESRVSLHEYIRDLKLANADETIMDSADDRLDVDAEDNAEPLAEAAFLEIEERCRACGIEGKEYPFEVDDNTLSLRSDADHSVYTFLALLSWYGKDAGPRGVNGEKLFEDVCGRAAAAYLGGPDPKVKWFVFGFPRRVQPRGFKDALDTLCKELGEGDGHRKGRPKLPDQKDAKLDVVAWREFDDRRQGKLITFGQCATGEDWTEKLSELPQCYDWCSNWMADRPAAWPIRLFFVPHRIEFNSWFDTCVKAGILHDRCRIASLTATFDADFRDEFTAWSRHVLQKIRGAN